MPRKAHRGGEHETPKPDLSKAVLYTSLLAGYIFMTPSSAYAEDVVVTPTPEPSPSPSPSPTPAPTPPATETPQDPTPPVTTTVVPVTPPATPEPSSPPPPTNTQLVEQATAQVAAATAVIAEVKTVSEAQPTPPPATTTTAITTAETTLATATTAIATATTAVVAATTAQTVADTAQAAVTTVTQTQLAPAQETVVVKTAEAATASAAVNVQEVVVVQATTQVAAAETTLATATVAVDAQQTVVTQVTATATVAQQAADSSNITDVTTHTFQTPPNDNLANPPAGAITVATVLAKDTNGNVTSEQAVVAGDSFGTTVISSAGSNQAGTNNPNISGNAIEVRANPNETMIRVANWSDASVVKVEFNVWAKNGEQVGTVRHVDGTTFEFIMKDLAGLPNYGEKITLNANTGNKIHEIFFPGTGDWYTLTT